MEGREGEKEEMEAGREGERKEGKERRKKWREKGSKGGREGGGVEGGREMHSPRDTSTGKDRKSLRCSSLVWLEAGLHSLMAVRKIGRWKRGQTEAVALQSRQRWGTDVGEGSRLVWMK